MRERLTRERILEAGLDLADSAGVEAITMRRLGEHLGFEAMSLYRHVANKDDLLDGMLDRVLAEWELPDGMARVNVHGSGISLGHPIGATGARILATLLRELNRRGARYGLETMCIGGGQGLAAVFENVQAA